LFIFVLPVFLVNKDIHCFTSSMTAHSNSILQDKNVLWPVRRRENALSVNCAINCMHSVEGRVICTAVSERRQLVTGTRAAGQGSK